MRWRVRGELNHPCWHCFLWGSSREQSVLWLRHDYMSMTLESNVDPIFERPYQILSLSRKAEITKRGWDELILSRTGLKSLWLGISCLAAWNWHVISGAPASSKLLYQIGLIKVNAYTDWLMIKSSHIYEPWNSAFRCLLPHFLSFTIKGWHLA